MRDDPTDPPAIPQGDEQPQAPLNIVTHERFSRPIGRPAGEPQPEPLDLDALRRVGLVSGDLPALSDLKMPEPQYGEEVIGELEPNEAVIYAAMYQAHAAFKQVEREVNGGALVQIGQRVKEAHEDITVSPNDFVTEEDAVRLFRAQRKANALREALYWTISERIGHHDWLLSVRTRGRIVRLQRKW